jgi:Domain of unknown function (DUF4190)
MSEPSDSIPPPPTSVYPTPQPGFPPNPAYTPYQSYGYPYPYPTMPVPPQMLPKGMAITGMVLGIVGLVTSLFYGGVLGVIGLVFSIIALRAARRGQAGGRGMAIAGLVTSILAIVVTTIEVILVVWFLNTVSNCSQYNPNTNPNGSSAQYDQCVRQGILGN